MINKNNFVITLSSRIVQRVSSNHKHKQYDDVISFPDEMEVLSLSLLTLFLSLSPVSLSNAIVVINKQ